MTSTHSPDALFDEIDYFITESNTLLDAGSYVELAGLDDNVRNLCEALISLSQEERIAHADRLQKLLWSLNDLEKAMMQRRDDLASQIRGLNNHQKANVAYRTAESSDAFKRDDEE